MREKDDKNSTYFKNAYDKQANLPKTKRKINPEDEGVYYNPTRSSSEFQTPKKIDRPTGKPRKAPRHAQKSGSSQYAMFIMLTVAGGIAVCIFVFAYMFNSFKTNTPQPTQSTETVTQNTPVAEDKYQEETALVKAINITRGLMELYAVNDGKTYSVLVEGKTLLKNKYGQEISLSEFKLGDIVDATFTENTDIAKSIKISAEAWEQKSIQKYTLDNTTNTITIGNSVYKLNDTAVILYNDTPVSKATISPTADVLTVKGYKDNAWSVIVEKSHGFVTVKNKDKVTDGTVEVDTTQVLQLSDIDKIELTEGNHKLAVKGQNIEPYVATLKVIAGETAEIDLATTQEKTGVVVTTLNTTDVAVTINGETQTKTDEPYVLKYGTYKFKVTKEGYDDWEKEIIVDKPTVTLKVDLAQQPKVEEPIVVIQQSQLLINSDPDGGDLYIDNLYIGLTPVKTKVDYGTHTITIKKDGYKQVPVQIQVTEPSREIVITLQKNQ